VGEPFVVGAFCKVLLSSNSAWIVRAAATTAAPLVNDESVWLICSWNESVPDANVKLFATGLIWALGETTIREEMVSLVTQACPDGQEQHRHRRRPWPPRPPGASGVVGHLRGHP
jgi:hypothetical protein